MAKKNDKEDTSATTEGMPELQTSEAEALDDTHGLVKMHKDGTSLHVHPTTVKAHADAGWKVA